jgi:hypothetical protein
MLYPVSRADRTGSVGPEDIAAFCGLKSCPVGLLLVKWLEYGEYGVFRGLELCQGVSKSLGVKVAVA